MKCQQIQYFDNGSCSGFCEIMFNNLTSRFWSLLVLSIFPKSLFFRLTRLLKRVNMGNSLMARRAFGNLVIAFYRHCLMIDVFWKWVAFLMASLSAIPSLGLAVLDPSFASTWYKLTFVSCLGSIKASTTNTDLWWILSNQFCDHLHCSKTLLKFIFWCRFKLRVGSNQTLEFCKSRSRLTCTLIKSWHLHAHCKLQTVKLASSEQI